MKELSMTPNAIKKRDRIYNPIFHAKVLDKNYTLCKRAFFDNDLKISEVNVTCKLCLRRKFILDRERGNG